MERILVRGVEPSAETGINLEPQMTLGYHTTNDSNAALAYAAALGQCDCKLVEF